jgi:hypothetical protein
MKTTIITVICCVFCFGCSVNKGNQSKSTSNFNNGQTSKHYWTTKELERLILTVQPWTDSEAYQSYDWRSLIRVADVFQTADNAQVIQAFVQFDSDNETNYCGNYLNNSRAYLLLRVIFNIPENGARSERSLDGWIRFDTDLNQDGTANLDWPISWKSGEPVLITRWIGYNGIPYRTKDDYIRLKNIYKNRDLHKYKND